MLTPSTRRHAGLTITGRTAEPVVPLARVGSDDAALVEGLRAERPQAIAELFDRFSGVVRTMLIRTLGSPRDVEDLAQETFLVVIRRISTLRDSSALSSFVIGVAIRVARNELRKRSLRRWVGLEEVEQGSAEQDPVVRESVARVYRALDRMNATSRVVFVLRHVEGLELTELATAMDVSLATVKRRLARAERRFEAIAGQDPLLRAYIGGGS